MLIEFKVANFRSIREPQTLSLVASNADQSLSGCVIKRNLPGLAGLRFLKGAALYGANASGKSNVIQAMGFLKNFVVNSATKLQPGTRAGRRAQSVPDPAYPSVRPQRFGRGQTAARTGLRPLDMISAALWPKNEGIVVVPHLDGQVSTPRACHRQQEPLST